ncbi:MlaD family protein [Williamsia sp.]|uniref:MlaD family protein n=1 Tax=Williamsia sp. TaxID=1872085 RepID=UPI002F9498A5
MVRRGISWALCVCAVVVALVVVTAGRGVNPANVIPRLMTSSSDSRVLYVDFVSVVNLPLGARVLLRGAQIGTLESIDLIPEAARLRLGIDEQAQVPVGSTAELRQSTLLGDIYVALTPPPDQTNANLGDGDTIPLQDTDPGPQIEDIITNLADFMSGGSILRVQDAIREVNDSVDVPGGNLPAAARVGAEDIQDLARGTDELNSIISSLQDATTEVARDPEALGYSMGPAGQKGLIAVFDSVNEGFKLVAGSGALAFGLNWLTPRLAELNPFLDELVPLLRTYSTSSTQINGNLGNLIDVAQTKIGPFLTNGAVSVDALTVNGDDTDVTRSVTSVLRMIGALR